MKKLLPGTSIHSSAAFTLVEILVGVAVSLVAILGIGSAMNMLKSAIDQGRLFDFETDVESKILAHADWTRTYLGDDLSLTDECKFGVSASPLAAAGVPLRDNSGALLYPMATPAIAGKNYQVHRGYFIQTRCNGIGRLQVSYTSNPNGSPPVFVNLFGGANAVLKTKKLEMENALVSCINNDGGHPNCGATGGRPVIGVLHMANDFTTEGPLTSAPIPLHNNPRTALWLCKELGFRGVGYQEARSYRSNSTLNDYWTDSSPRNVNVTGAPVTLGNRRRGYYNGNAPIKYYKQNYPPVYEVSNQLAPADNSTTEGHWIGRLHCVN